MKNKPHMDFMCRLGSPPQGILSHILQNLKNTSKIQCRLKLSILDKRLRLDYFNPHHGSTRTNSGLVLPTVHVYLLLGLTLTQQKSRYVNMVVFFALGFSFYRRRVWGIGSCKGFQHC